MIAEILAVGTELLLGDITNTNARFLSQELSKLGINVYTHTVVGDNPKRLLAAFTDAFRRADLVIATGGLGPTEDDITKEIAAEYFHLPLVLHEDTWSVIKRHFKGSSMPQNNQKQAMLPEGCTVLPNGNGTAPGVCIERDGKIAMLFPGPPNELEPMFLTHGVPFLRPKTNSAFVSRVLKITGVGESRVAEMLKDLLDEQTNPTIAPYAKISEVWLRLTASASDENAARQLIGPLAETVYHRLGCHIYGEDNDTLESVVIGLLRKRQLTLACAESCTGGMLTSALVNVSGVSDVLLEGLVTYANTAKSKRLGVRESTLTAYGAVSAETAVEMAEGAAKTSGASVGLSTTGIAGPDGGTVSKPVGLVYVGLYFEGQGTWVKELRLNGDRQKIRQRTVVNALDFLREKLK